MQTLKLPWLLPPLQPVDFPHKLGIMDRFFRRALAANGVAWVNTAAGIPWKLDLAYAPHRWIVYGKYEGREFLDWAKAFLKPTSLVVDSGANIGQVLLYLAQWVSKGKILAFEPGKYQAAWLHECLRENLHLPVEIMPLGLGERECSAHLKNDGPEYTRGGWSQISEGEGEAINLVSLSDFLNKRSIPQVDLWKLDVEGYELPALRGAREHLRRKAILALYVELAGANRNAVPQFLSEYGYVCYSIEGSKLVRSGGDLPEHSNRLFLPA